MTDIVAETLNEFILLERIKVLERRLWEKGLSSVYSAIPTDMDLIGAVPISLKLAASVEAGWERDGRISVTGRTYTGPKQSMGFYHYISQEQCEVWTDYARAKALAFLHQKLLHQLAGSLSKERKA